MWIAANCPEFISKDECPPNSPDLNPLDYHVWDAMLDLYQKYQRRSTNISELKVALRSIWNDLLQDPIDRSTLSFTKRLKVCIKANGGHFEHRVWLTNCILVATICCTVVQYQQTDKIRNTALFYIENALFYVVNFSNVLLLFVDDFDNL